MCPVTYTDASDQDAETTLHTSTQRERLNLAFFLTVEVKKKHIRYIVLLIIHLVTRENQCIYANR